MAHSDMEIFNSFMYTAVTETLDQQIDLFNEASRGTIVLRSGRNIGDYDDMIFYKAFSTQYRRRDVYTTGAVAGQALTQGTETSVKVAGANGPFTFDASQFSYLQRNPEEGALVIGEQVAMAIMQDYLNTSVGSLSNRLSGDADLEYDGSAGTLTLNALNKGAALFGDKAQDIRAWIMHSKAYHDLIDAGITNSNQLFEFGSVQIVTDQAGRPLVVSDIPELLTTGTPDTYQSLGLVTGAIACEDNGDFFSNMETNNGDINIQRTWQSEYTYNVRLKGYQWDKANGGASPTDAELFTATNWDKVATYDKDTAGVSVKTQ